MSLEGSIVSGNVIAIVGILLCIAVVLVLLYLFAIMPRMLHRPDYQMLMGWHYAHRGLHDNESDSPENSMAAFRKAVEAGFGMELDVQLTKDRIPVVFHDETLKRVCGVDGKVRDYTYEELQKFKLCKSQEKIPLFEDLLKMVDGRVPLIIEIKIHEKASTVCSIADKLMKEYQGPYCIESFHPLAVNWYRTHRPEVVRGQLSSNFNEPGKRESIALFLVHYLMFNFLGKPDFIAYDHHHKKNLSRRLCTKLYGALSVAWTIKSQKEMDESREDFELFIFEGFVPEKRR